MNSKRPLLGLVGALLAMAALSAFIGQTQGAILCSVMAGVGGLIVAFGFQKGVRCTCAECGGSIFVPKKIGEGAKVSLQAAGWRFQDSLEYCPECVKDGVAATTQAALQ